MLGRQLADDIQKLPDTARERLSESGRAQRAVNIADLRALARRRLPKGVYDYVDGAAWDEVTKQRNESDLQSLALRPRMLVGATEIDLSTEVLGRRIEVPLLGAPTGLTGLVHHEGEVGIARAVHSAGGLYVLSSAASRSLEEVATASPGPRWFQLYVGPDRGVAKALIQRARATGYEALIVTVDVARPGPRERDQRNGFTVPPRVTAHTLVDGVRRPRWTANFLSRPRILSEGLLSSVVTQGAAVSLGELIGRQFDPGLSWSDIAWVQEHWDGPLMVKGILRGDDARQAAGMGLAGVIVSNHGGRQLDHATSTIRALPEIVDAAGGRARGLHGRWHPPGRGHHPRAGPRGARLPGGPRPPLRVGSGRACRGAARDGDPHRRASPGDDADGLPVGARPGRELVERAATRATRGMPMEHVIDPSRIHHAWNRDREPTLRIANGDSVRFALRMAGAEQIREGDSYADTNFIADQIYWLLGPVFVEGAHPGDTLRVDILSLRPGEWGWCGTEPDLGLLPADFPDPFVKTFDLRGRDSVTVCPEVEIPLSPFLGTMGTHPDEPGDLPAFPPHRGGGNIDTRHLTVGSTLWLPVWCEGALFSCGDPHGVQGDGEVCLAALECDMDATLRFSVERRTIGAPRFRTGAR